MEPKIYSENSNCTFSLNQAIRRKEFVESCNILNDNLKLSLYVKTTKKNTKKSLMLTENKDKLYCIWSDIIKKYKIPCGCFNNLLDNGNFKI